MGKIKSLQSRKFIVGSLVAIAFLVFQISCEKDDDMMGTPDPDECKPDISFQMDIKPIIDSKCIQCHNGDVQPLDFRTYQPIKDNAGQVKALTASGAMPRQGSLTEEQIKLIGCWVDEGAPDN